MNQRIYLDFHATTPVADEVAASPVLAAMSVCPEIGRGAVRFSLGRSTTRDEIEAAIQQLASLCLARPANSTGRA